jgi:hypothetical protein
MLKEMLKVLARYEEEAEVFGGDLEFDLTTKMYPAAVEKIRIFIQELYDLKLITCSDEQMNNGLVTVHSARARWILEALG